MKKNKLLWIVLPVAGIMIAAVIMTAVLMINSQKKEDRYREQMQAARLYLEEADYTKVISAYQAAIELRPESPEAYLGLAEVYLEQDQYYEAGEVIRLGMSKIEDKRLNDMLDLIEISRVGEFREKVDVELLEEELIVDGEDNENLALKNDTIRIIGEYCYQQYLNEYGDSSIEYISSEEGYRAKFKGLNVYAYFINTAENRDLVNESTREPAQRTKPYKVQLQDPGVLFVGYEGYISNKRLTEIFGRELIPVRDENSGVSYVEFEYLDCKLKIETDAEGNVYKENPFIELRPLNPVSDWVEEVEEEEEEEEETFVLAGTTYSYDVREIYITGAVLDDLTPLSRCKELQYISFVSCEISDLSPLSGCTSLVTLLLDGSYGNLDLSCLSGMTNLRYLHFHRCPDISDIGPIMGLDLEVLHPCESSVSLEQVEEYMAQHPNCEVWYDYMMISGGW